MVSSKVVRKLTNEYLKTNIGEPYVNLLHKGKWKNIQTIQWLLMIFTSLVLCAYQSCERIIYFASAPIRVQADLIEQHRHRFPAVNIITPFTVQSTQFAKSKINLKMCDHTSAFYYDNKTTIREIWDLKNAVTEIKNVTFKRGNKNYSTQFRIQEIDTPLGRKAQITNEHDLPLDSAAGIHIQFDYNTQETFCDLHFVVVDSNEKVNKFAVTSKFQLNNFFKRNEFIFTSRKYKFLNTTETPCINVHQMDECHEQCYLSFISKMPCQLPFLPNNSEADCLANEISCQLIFHVRDVRESRSPHYVCNCPRECNREIILSWYHFSDTEIKKCVVRPLSNWIPVFTEYYYYNFISLLCDIGGFLGFYTGLSCLHMFEIVTRIIWWQWNRHFLYSKKTNHQKRILRTIEKVAHKNKIISTNTKPSTCRYTKMFILLFIICFCGFEMYERINCFLVYPVYTKVEVVEDRFVQVPSVVMCSEADDILEAKKQVAKEICFDDIDILQLIDAPSLYQHSIEKLWSDSSLDIESCNLIPSENTLSNSIYKCRIGNLSYIQTIFGNCIRFDSDMIEYNPATVPVFLSYSPTNIGCNPHSKIFLLDQIGNVDYKTFFIHPHNSWLFVKFSLQTVIRLNTPINPCLNQQEYAKCQTDCLRKKLEHNLACRLPYMDFTFLPLCNSTVSAKASRDSYLHIFSKLLADCNCPALCCQNINVAHAEYDQSCNFTKFLTLSLFTLENDNREVFIEQLTLPLSKLISDIGAILGICLGLSLITLLNYLQTFIYSLYKR